MKNFKILAIALFVAPFAKAQTLAEAIKKTENERYASAQADFEKLIAAEPANSKLYFYYGENFFENDQLDKANEQWKKGLSIDPKCMLNTVGAGKYKWFNGDTTAGRADFNAALAGTKNKNAEVMRQIAEVLVKAPKKDAKGAVALMDKAIRIEPSNVENNLIKGDALLELTPADGSPAIKSYNAALAIDPASAKALVKTAQLYQNVGSNDLANDKYLAAQKADPTYAPAYRYKGELNLSENKPAEAAQNFTKYLELNNDTEARYRYAAALYVSRNFCEALKEVNRVESEGISDVYTKRMLTISLYECNKAGDSTAEVFRQALAASDLFFQLAKEKEIVGADYANRGAILTALGEDSLGMIEKEKAIQLDPVGSRDLVADLIKLYGEQRNYTKLIALYEAKAGGDYKKLTPADNLDLGKAHYFGSLNYVEADSAFARLTRQAPTYAIGFAWKGRSSYKLDDPKSPQYLAQPAYEQFLTLLTPEEMNTPAYKEYAAEAARYLGDYYVRSSNRDLPRAKEYWGIVRTLYPQDQQAKNFFASPEGK